MDFQDNKQLISRAQDSIVTPFGVGVALFVAAALGIALSSGVGHRDARTRTAAVEQRSTSSERISAAFGRLAPGIASPALTPASVP